MEHSNIYLPQWRFPIRFFCIQLIFLGLGSCKEDATTELEPSRSDPGSKTTAALEAQSSPIDEAITYREPSQKVVDVVDAPPTPRAAVSPDGNRIALAFYPPRPPIAQLAEPILRLAGTRIHPARTEKQQRTYYNKIEIVTVEEGKSIILDTPEGGRLGMPTWSPDEKQMAFTVTVKNGVELWTADPITGKTRRLTPSHLNATFSSAFKWIPNPEGGFRILARLVPSGRGPAPSSSNVPTGPIITETQNRDAPNRTYQDLLDSKIDEALFEHYFTSELALIDPEGNLERLPAKGIFHGESVSPDGKHLLLTRIKPPFSKVVPYYRFSRSFEVWALDKPGKPHVLADLPAAEEVPIQGVPKGPRLPGWIPNEPSTVYYAEALDEGDPNKQADFRDRIMLASPFDAAPKEMTRLTHRYRGINWLETQGRYLVTEYDRDKRWTTTHLRDKNDSSFDTIFADRSVHDRYGDPGRPVHKKLRNGKHVVRVEENTVFLAGQGASPAGDRPFLDRRDLISGDSKRIFESPEDAYASFVHFWGSTKKMIIRRESTEKPPNFFLLKEERTEKPITAFPHPYPNLKKVETQLLTYKRKDGIDLSGTLYLPPGYDKEKDGKLPMYVYAYPVEYTDAKTAAQVRAAPTKFSHLGSSVAKIFVLEGYAVLYGAAMPVVGDPKNMNDTLVPQIVGSAEAAIAAVDKLGVIDRNRVGIGGHSYGAFMTANLLAHCDLFKAGIARSGAYNRSLTPFGFQSERRTLWEATDTYIAVSPLFHADKINEPLLIVHGEIDNNSGTFPIQSKRLFHAISGLGGHARMIILPHESHVYRSRESTMHVLFESFEWFKTHLQ